MVVGKVLGQLLPTTARTMNEGLKAVRAPRLHEETESIEDCDDPLKSKSDLALLKRVDGWNADAR